MKVCKKCKKEYKDDYTYCPKCGKPYDDNLKPVRTPEDLGSGVGKVLNKIVNIILYVIGGFIVLGSILTIAENPLFSIIGILFGLSLFQIFYKIIEDKISIESKYLIIARVILPIILLIVWGIATPPDIEQESNNSTGNLEVEIILKNI